MDSGTSSHNLFISLKCYLVTFVQLLLFVMDPTIGMEDFAFDDSESVVEPASSQSAGSDTLSSASSTNKVLYK